jgi:hypothetical protein
MVKQRRAISLNKWEAEACEWNKQKPPGLCRAHQQHEQLLQLQLRLAIQPRTPDRTASPTTNMSQVSLLPTQVNNVVSPGIESATAPEEVDPWNDYEDVEESLDNIAETFMSSPVLDQVMALRK